MEMERKPETEMDTGTMSLSMGIIAPLKAPTN